MGDNAVWAMFYAGIVSIQFHPRNAGAFVDFDQLADAADEMLKRYRAREEVLWRGSQPVPPLQAG